jgi:hypothetical protein
LLSHKGREREKKKKRVWRQLCEWLSVAVACLLTTGQPVVDGGIIYADLWGKLNTPLAPDCLFTQSPVCKPLLQAFPFPSPLGEVTLHLLSQACMFIYSSCGKWVFPLLLWSFPPHHSHKLSCSWLLEGSCPLWPGLACLFTVL